MFHQKLFNNRIFFYILKKIIKIQLRKLGQSTSVYRSLNAILQRTDFLKKKPTTKQKKLQQTHTKPSPHLKSLWITRFHNFLYFLVQEHKAGILGHIMFSVNRFDC